MSQIRILKYQALGNSYLILDPSVNGADNRHFERLRSGQILPRKHLVRILCDRSYGLGSNGLLFGPLDPSGQNVFGLRIINSDGTSAGFSGNGVRIFAQYLRDAGYLTSNHEFNIEVTEDASDGGAVNAVAVRLLDLPSPLIEVSLPHAPRFGAPYLAADDSLVGQTGGTHLEYCVQPLASLGLQITGHREAWSSSTLVEIGNPHCVTFVEKMHIPNEIDLRGADPLLRAIAFRPAAIVDGKPLFGNGANLQWAHVLDRRHIALTIFERGEGPTKASGSSASAVACAAFARGLIDAEVEIIMAGGSLAIRLNGTPDNITAVTLTGRADRILDGMVDVNDLSMDVPPVFVG